MKKYFLLLTGALVAMLALTVACGPGLKGAIPTGPAAQPTSRGDAVKGKTLFTGTCSSCHGADAKGLPNLGKDLTTSTFAKGLSDDELYKFVSKGRPTSDPANTTGVDMPPRGGNPALKEKDLYDIIAFVRTVQK